MIHVLVCHGREADRRRIGRVLAGAGDVAASGEADSVGQALARVRQGGIDLVLMDVALPQRDGLDLLRQLRGEFPRLPLLMSGPQADRQDAVRALKLGAAGCLAETADAAQMSGAIHQVVAGRLFVGPVAPRPQSTVHPTRGMS